MCLARDCYLLCRDKGHLCLIITVGQRSIHGRQFEPQWDGKSVVVNAYGHMRGDEDSPGAVFSKPQSLSKRATRQPFSGVFFLSQHQGLLNRLRFHVFSLGKYPLTQITCMAMTSSVSSAQCSPSARESIYSSCAASFRAWSPPPPFFF